MSKKMLGTMLIWWMVLFGVMLSTFQMVEGMSFTTVGATPASYQTFIKSVRDRVVRGGTAGSPPTLPLPTNSIFAGNKVKDRFVEVDLSNGDKIVTLIIDVTDLYVVGIRVNKPTTYFYLKTNPTLKPLPTLFPNGVQLDFDGSYPDLQRQSGKTRANSNLGVGGVNQAIFSMAKTVKNKENQRSIAAGLIVAIQFVSEAARFHHIESEISKTMSDHSQTLIPDSYTLDLENSWGNLCKLAQGTSTNSVTIGSTVVRTKQQALDLLAVMKTTKSKVFLQNNNNDTSTVQLAADDEYSPIN